MRCAQAAHGCTGCSTWSCSILGVQESGAQHRMHSTSIHVLNMDFPRRRRRKKKRKKKKRKKRKRKKEEEGRMKKKMMMMIPLLPSPCPVASNTPCLFSWDVNHTPSAAALPASPKSTPQFAVKSLEKARRVHRTPPQSLAGKSWANRSRFPEKFQISHPKHDQRCLACDSLTKFGVVCILLQFFLHFR